MKTISVQGYSYSELSETAKQKVQEWVNYDMRLFDKYDRQQWTEDLEKLGYEDIDIRYSGFCFQGDGASIACTVNVQEFIKRNKLSKKYASLLYWLRKAFGTGGGLKIVRSNRMNYVHEYMLSADSYDLINDLESYDCPAKPIEQVEELEGAILEEVREKSRELYKWLEADYDWHFTDEYMIDCCDANEYIFDKYGNPIHNLELA